jgi:hypothetical protein
MARVQRRADEVVRITTASSSAGADVARRQGRYLISMGIRTICFVGAILVGSGWLRWTLIAAALLLPYVAVVMANAATTKSDGFDLVDHGIRRPELPPTRQSGDDAT